MQSQRSPFKHVIERGKDSRGNIPWPEEQKQILRDMIPEYIENGVLRMKKLAAAYNHIAGEMGFPLREYGTISNLILRERRKKEAESEN
ncbi:MAG: hypothetical protein ABIH25_02470 [Candidatus Woesearchaeota archaeon]